MRPDGEPGENPSPPAMMAPAADLARIKRLFLEVCELPDAAARRSWLAAQGVDAATQERVWALVRSDQGATRIGEPVAAAMAQALEEPPNAAVTPASSGDLLGPWRLLQPLGAGGMGQVFLAERADGLYQRRVAIKLLRGHADAAALALLARERQILAGLAHAHIARLLDGGTTQDGHPYLVMELVQGERIDHWCRRRGTGLAQRLALFAQVCGAVGEAHRRLVVHCDIKPANVLVNEDGQALLLDFGVARLQAQEGDDPAVQGLTPRYASPEQLAGTPATPASDVFGLGRLLEVLLEDQHLPAGRRRELRALLDQALAPDPAARYRDVAELMADLQRWQQHRPLRAMPRRWTYRAARLLRRQWPWALAGAAGVGIVVVFTWRLVQERDRAIAAEQRTRQEAQAAEQITQLLVGLFEGADPSNSGKVDVSAVELVDRGRQQVARELAGQPVLLARMQGVLGHVYAQMGRSPQALPLLEQALDMTRGLPADERGAEPALLARLAMARANASDAGRAEPAARQALALTEAAAARAGSGTREALALADAADTLGYVLSQRGQHDAAQQRLLQALALRREHLGAAHPLLAITLHHLGVLQTSRGALGEGERHYRDSLAMKRAVLRPNHPSALNTLQALAANLSLQRRHEEAEPLLLELLAQREALFGPRSEMAAHTLNELGSILQDAGRTGEAIDRYRQALALPDAAAADALHAMLLNNLATALEELEDPRTESTYRQALTLRRTALPPGDLGIARTEHNLARWLLRQAQEGLPRRLEQAEALAASARATRIARLPDGHRERTDSELQHAMLLQLRGRPGAAEEILRLLEPRLPMLRDTQRLLWHRTMARVALAQGSAQAALAHAEQAVAHAQKSWPSRHPGHTALAIEVAAVELAAGRADAARQSLSAAGPGLRAYAPTGPAGRAAAALRAALATPAEPAR